jgi:hypothetical protein
LGQSRELQRREADLPVLAWRRAVGSRIADKSRPVAKQGTTLVVEVQSSTWAQELSFLSATIVDKLRAEGIAVTDVRYRVGRRQPSRQEPPVAPARAVRQAPLPSDLAARLQGVDDPILRQAIERAARFNLGIAREKKKP